jgi:hypothetical protein
METKPNTLTPYDVLGYFVPGSILLFFAHCLFVYHWENSHSYVNFLKSISDFKVAALFPFFILAYLVGHILSFFSYVTFQRYAIWAYGVPCQYLLGYKSPGYFNPKTSSPRLSKTLRALVAIAIAPVSLFEFLFGSVLKMRNNYIKGLDPMIRKLVKTKLLDILNQELYDDGDEAMLPDPREDDFLPLALHHAIEKAPNHVYSLRNYVVLYGFLRTSAFAMLLSFWGGIGCAVWNLFHKQFNWCIMIPIVMFGGIAFTLYIAFVRFYQKHGEETLMAITTIQSAAKGG